MTVVNNAFTHRFEMADTPMAFLQYARRDRRIRLVHTEVPSALRGRGYASQLARAALEYAQDERLAVEPDCPFVRRYLTKHPEFNSLVASDWSGDRSYTQTEERRIREAALDDTIAESFPASDPASTNPNPFKKI